MKTKIIFGSLTVLLIGLVVWAALRPTEIDDSHDISGVMIGHAELSNITFEEGVINIYYFWGSTCPHCARQFAFFESLAEEYGDYINIYGFEVWGNSENAGILREFAEAMGDTVGGVPYTIIGSQSFTGFSPQVEAGILNAIRNRDTEAFDVFRKIDR